MVQWNQERALATIWVGCQSNAGCPDLWFSLPKDRRELFQRWLAEGQNLEATETSLIVAKERAAEQVVKQELLTIAEMVERGMSASGSWKPVLCKCACCELARRVINQM